MNTNRSRFFILHASFFMLFLSLHSPFFIPSAQAQVLAIGVEQKAWTIDSDTAVKGITLGNLGERVKIGIMPGALLGGSRVEIATFASEYYLNLGEVHRITPMYRLVIKGNAGVTLPVEIRYPSEALGKKILRVWGDDNVWRDIPSQSVADKNRLRAEISTGTTYLAVFSHNQVLEKGLASWYKYKNCHCAASPDYPPGARLKVTNVDNGKSVVVKVNDFGPDRLKHPERVIDLDRAAFEHLANPKVGVVSVKVESIN
ncbi:hypothetical protein HYW17_05785 [Candidatus Uhrbacteria bacterium]|nr:hypothetical protein [Candidatus Uhrbacteria bacterium]